MSSEWTELKLGEIVTFKTGKLDSNAAEEKGQFPFFTCSPNTLAINSYAFDTEAVILAGNNANGVFSIKHYSGKFNAYQRTYVIEPINKETVSCRYTYFLLDHMVGRLKELSVGSATKFLTKTILNALPVRLPPKLEQDVIGSMLSALDDRITLLRETNKTLESIAQAIFKSWFVDFDPVHAKANGIAPEGMDEATAALFPDSFEETELGMMPKGWSISALGNEVNIAYGKNLPTIKLLDHGYPVFGGNGQIGFYDKYLYESRQILIACRGAASGKVNQSSPKSFVTNNSLVLEHSEKSRIKFGYTKGWMLKTDLTQFVTGSAQPQVTIDNLKHCKILVPNFKIICLYEEYASLVEVKIESNKNQENILINLRDTLLPRLISGQLQIEEAQEMVESV